MPAERAGKPVALEAVVEIPFQLCGEFLNGTFTGSADFWSRAVASPPRRLRAVTGETALSLDSLSNF